MEYFRKVINSTEDRNGKRKPPLKEYIRMSRSKMQRDTIFLLRAKLSTQNNLGNFPFLISSCDSTRFYRSQVVRTRISPKALTAEALHVVNAYTQIRNKIFFALFSFRQFHSQSVPRVLIAWCVVQQISVTSGKLRVSYLS